MVIYLRLIPAFKIFYYFYPLIVFVVKKDVIPSIFSPDVCFNLDCMLACFIYKRLAWPHVFLFFG